MYFEKYVLHLFFYRAHDIVDYRVDCGPAIKKQMQRYFLQHEFETFKVRLRKVTTHTLSGDKVSPNKAGHQLGIFKSSYDFNMFRVWQI